MLATVAFTAALLAMTTTDARAEECKRTGQVLKTTVVYFDFDSTAVNDGAKARLQGLAEQYKADPSLEVCVLGQADKAGNVDYNKQLALRRANAVADVLKDAGMADKPFQIVSRGEAFAPDGLLVRLFGEKVQFDSDRRVEVLMMRR